MKKGKGINNEIIGCERVRRIRRIRRILPYMVLCILRSVIGRNDRIT